MYLSSLRSVIFDNYCGILRSEWNNLGNARFDLSVTPCARFLSRKLMLLLICLPGSSSAETIYGLIVMFVKCCGWLFIALT